MPVLTDDVRIDTLKPLLPPAILMEEIPLSEEASRAVVGWRAEVANIIAGKDDRLVVVVGPCSIHDPEAGLEYARRLKTLLPKGWPQVERRTVLGVRARIWVFPPLELCREF